MHIETRHPVRVGLLSSSVVTGCSPNRGTEDVGFRFPGWVYKRWAVLQALGLRALRVCRPPPNSISGPRQRRNECAVLGSCSRVPLLAPSDGAGS